MKIQNCTAEVENKGKCGNLKKWSCYFMFILGNGLTVLSIVSFKYKQKFKLK